MNTHPRPYTFKGHNFNFTLMVDQLFNPATMMWNMELLNAIIDLMDNPIVRKVPISRTYKTNSLGWYFIKSGKYIIKSGYLTKHNKSISRTLL